MWLCSRTLLVCHLLTVERQASGLTPVPWRAAMTVSHCLLSCGGRNQKGQGMWKSAGKSGLVGPGVPAAGAQLSPARHGPSGRNCQQGCFKDTGVSQRTFVPHRLYPQPTLAIADK